MNARLLPFEINCQYLFLTLKYFFLPQPPFAHHPHPSPVARTYWQWRATLNPFALYQPTSSAAGMYQMINETFQEALALPHPPPRGGRRRSLGRSARYTILRSRQIPRANLAINQTWLYRIQFGDTTGKKEKTR